MYAIFTEGGTALSGEEIHPVTLQTSLIIRQSTGKAKNRRKTADPRGSAVFLTHCGDFCSCLDCRILL